MVIREDPDSADVLCIPQSQHAAVSAQIARAWGNEEFAAPAPWDDVIEAAARHDDGMNDFDAEPELDPETGLPRSFMKMPLELWLQCWTEGPSEVAEDTPYAGILVSLHGCGLLERRRLQDEHQRIQAVDYLAEQEDLREEWAADVEEDPEAAPGLGLAALQANRALLVAWDAMSLAVCMPRLPERFEQVPSLAGSAELEMNELESERIEVGPPILHERVIAVSPWPFTVGSVELEATGRILTERFEDRATMQQALVDAETAVLRARLVEGEGSGGGS